MEEAILNFMNMVYNEFIGPLFDAFNNFVNENSLLLGDTFYIFFNWLFNIGRETPIEFFKNTADAQYFFEDLLLYILLFIAINLIIKIIKIIFKPIFKLFNIGSDIKWRR